MAALVRVGLSGRVATVTMDRPEVHNAFNAELIAELTAALARVGGDPEVRAVVLAAEGKSFSAGADINWMRAMAGFGEAENHADALKLAELMRTLNYLGKPTIARVNGSAYGGGVGLVAACDIAIACFDAQFALTEVKLGLIPAAISPHVIAAIGERYARRYMLTAERFSAAEAYRIGLLHEIVSDTNGLDEALGEIVDALLGNGPEAIAECKTLIDTVAWQRLSPALIEDTAQRITRRRSSSEGREGMSAFLEKRNPNWRLA